MRHGRKSSQQRFDGYKLSAAVTNNPEPLIMAVHVAPGGENDGPQAKHLIDAQAKGRRPERVLGDTAYGNGPAREELAKRNVEVLAPVPEGKVVEGRFGKHDFAIDLKHGTVSCPAGHTVQIGVSAKGFRQAGFSAKVCGGCPLKARCCPGRARRQVKLGEHDELLLAARRALADPDTADIYAERDHGSSGCSGSSPTATAHARAATSAPPRHDYRRRGPPRWSTSTRSDTDSPTKPPNRPRASRPPHSPARPNQSHGP
jgi:Transposase DDE domain